MAEPLRSIIRSQTFAAAFGVGIRMKRGAESTCVRGTSEPCPAATEEPIHGFSSFQLTGSGILWHGLQRRSFGLLTFRPSHLSPPPETAVRPVQEGS